MFDQMLFTWVPNGPAGAGFQPVAVTPGLADSTSRRTRTALRFCRYRRPAEVDDPTLAPVSYGWWDRGGDRFVFRRGYLGRASSGRPGNFYAHILVGPIAEAGAVDLACRVDSVFWWRGEPIDGDIAPVGLSAITNAPVPEVSTPDLEAFTDAVLGRRNTGPVRVSREPAIVVALLAALARRLPDLVAPLSVSTYEDADDQGDFDVVGVFEGRDNLGASTPQVRQARRFVLSEDPSDRAVVTIAASGATKDGRVTPARLLRCIGVIVDLREGRQPSPDALASALAHSAAARDLLDLRTGRAAVAQAVAAAHHPTWDALACVASDVPTRLLDAVASEAGRAAGVRDQVDPDLVGVHCSRMPDSYARALRAGVLAAAADRRPPWMTELAEQDAVSLIRSAPHGSPSPAVRVLLSLPAGELTVESAELPVDWRGIALAGVLRRDPKALNRWITALTREPLLVGHLAREADVEPLAAALTSLKPPSSAVHLAVAAIRGLHGRARDRLIDLVAVNLPTESKVALFTDTLTASDDSDNWDGTVAAAITDHVARLAPGTPPEPLLRLARTLTGPECSRWAAVLDDRDPVQAMSSATDLRDPRATETAIRHVLGVLALEDPDRTTVESVVDVLRVGGYSHERVAAHLIRTVRRLRCQTDGLAYLSLVFDWIERGRLRLVPFPGRARLRDRKLQALASSVLGALSQHQWNTARKAIHAGGRSHRWWRGLPGNR